MERPTCPWTCLKAAPLSSLSAPRCLHTQTHLQRKLACDACSHAANEEACTALCCGRTHAYFTRHKRVKHRALELKGRFRGVEGHMRQAAVARHTTEHRFLSGLDFSASSAVNGSKMDFSTYGVRQKEEHKMSLKPAGFALNSAEDNNLDADKTVLRVRFFGSNTGEITSESGKQDSVSPADSR